MCKLGLSLHCKLVFWLRRRILPPTPPWLCQGKLMNCFLLVPPHTKYILGVAGFKGKMEPVGNMRCDIQVTNDEV